MKYQLKTMLKVIVYGLNISLVLSSHASVTPSVLRKTLVSLPIFVLVKPALYVDFTIPTMVW